MSTAAPAATAYDELVRLSREASLLGGTAGLLGWDQEVLMPAGGIAYRGRQLAQLARLRHEIMTSRRMSDLLAACEDDPAITGEPRSAAAVNVRELRRDHDRAARLPAALVEEEARLASESQHTWSEARGRADFAHFRPVLERVVDLLRRKADCYGWAEAGEVWDALAEDYEPGCTAAEVEAVFTPLRDRLAALVRDLMDRGTPPATEFNALVLPVADQKRFVRFVSESIGFDYDRGRLDVSTHPFCSGSHPGDVRLTTRFHDANVNDALGSTMHEAGHGIYEQGLPMDHWGTPMGSSVSLGIHESQSRLWENQVGRSRAFWEWLHPRLGEFFGDRTRGLALDDVFGAANVVRPDFIRVEADEATYNLHIMIRFELERQLLRGDLDVADLPEAWNARYRELLGIEVPDDAKGCLQDIHWSMCAMGYFPTYTLGNLHAAQLFEAAGRELGDLDAMFRRGEFEPLRRWLNRTVHAHGRRFRAAELCEEVTGEPLSAEPLMRHLESKLRPLYGV